MSWSSILVLIPVIFLGCQNPLAYQTNDSGDKQTMNTKQLCPVEKKMILQKGDQVFIAKIIYQNTSQNPIYINPDLLQLYITLKGEELDDISRQVKRRPRTIDEYIKLSPAEEIILSFDLLEHYAFVVGTYQYEAHLIQGYWDPVSDETCEQPEQVIPFEYTYVAT